MISKHSIPSLDARIAAFAGYYRSTGRTYGGNNGPLISVVVPVGVADAGKLADKDIMRLGVDVGQFLLSEVCSTVITRGNMYLSVLP